MKGAEKVFSQTSNGRLTETRNLENGKEIFPSTEEAATFISTTLYI